MTECSVDFALLLHVLCRFGSHCLLLFRLLSRLFDMHLESVTVRMLEPTHTAHESFELVKPSRSGCKAYQLYSRCNLQNGANAVRLYRGWNAAVLGPSVATLGSSAHPEPFVSTLHHHSLLRSGHSNW